MKKTFKYILMFAAMIGFSACQPDSYRTVYPNETPAMEATMGQTEVLYGTDSLDVNVHITATTTPLSTLTVMVTVGEQENTKKIVEETLRTKDMEYSASLRYAVPFKAGMAEGAPVKVYLTAENVEGDQNTMILTGCTGHRPSVETLYMMPPTISYSVLGKGYQMTKTADNEFTIDNLSLPKTFNCLFAAVGTKFGRIDWTQPVFGLIDGEVTLLPQDVIDEIKADNTLADNYAITIADDNFASITKVSFNTLDFAYTFDGKVVTPVTTLDVLTDLEENPSYMSSSSAAKEYRGAKIFFDQNSEVEITGVVDLSKAYNPDYMEYLGGNKIKFLGEKAMYYVSYKTAEDYIVVEPLYDLEYPEVMYMCGVGMGQPSYTPTASSGWGFDSPNQNFVGRTIAPKIYQFTVYMNNDAENTDHPGFGAVNFKFFHQHGWGGEEASTDYTQVCCDGMTIVSSSEESNVGNWWSNATLFEGVYRVTLDMNKMTTTYEKVR